MADCVRREVTLTWIEYSLPTPSVWGELRKMIHAAQQELGDAVAWDDAAEVRVTDNEIIIRWPKEDTPS